MDTKKIPAIVMLLAGAVAVVVTYLNHYTFRDMLMTLVWVLIIFFVIGVIVRIILEASHIGLKEEQEETIINDEGEVVDKTSESEEADENLEGDQAEQNGEQVG